MHTKKIYAVPSGVVLLGFFFLLGCSKADTPAPADRGALLDVRHNGTLNKADIESRISEFTAQGWAEQDVDFYAITYRSQYMGKPVDTRGLLIIPKGSTDVDLLMYCHGTEMPSKLLGAENISPSSYTGSTETHRDVRNMGLGWASKGFVVFIPDYIGYGLTLGRKEHPYMYYSEMFLSNIDGLKAVKQYLSQNGFRYDNQLFISGWSLGGGASLSAHKYIQEQYPGEFNIAASSSLAGVLNYERFHDEALQKGNENVSSLWILSWAVYSINKFSTLQRPTDQLYNYPVNDQMSAVLVRSFQPNKVFKPYFLSNVLNGTDIAYRNIIAQNSYSKGWLPTGKVFLHHGDADDVVPYFNSADTKAGLEAAGGTVTLYTYPGGKHDTELGNFFRQTFTDFNALR